MKAVKAWAISTGLMVTLAIVCVLVTISILWRVSSSVSPAAPPVSNTLGPEIRTQSVRFAAVGDFDNTTQTNAVLAGLAQSKPDFALALGDLAYDSTKNELQWCDIVKNTVGATLPFQLIAGNHDTPESSKTMSIDRFAACLPNRIPNTTGIYGQQYFFDHERLLRVIMISPDITVNGHSYTYTQDDTDYIWLQNAIDQARQEQIKWIVVGMHKNCITIGEKPCEISPELLNMLISKKVDLILQGHEHAYMRTKQLIQSSNCTAILPTSPSESCILSGTSQSNGVTTYQSGLGSIVAIVGTGGAPLRKLNLQSPQKSFFAAYNGLGTNDAYGSLIVNADNQQLKAKFVDTATKVRDSFMLVKP